MNFHYNESRLIETLIKTQEQIIPPRNPCHSDQSPAFNQILTDSDIFRPAVCAQPQANSSEPRESYYYTTAHTCRNSANGLLRESAMRACVCTDGEFALPGQSWKLILAYRPRIRPVPWLNCFSTVYSVPGGWYGYVSAYKRASCFERSGWDSRKVGTVVVCIIGNVGKWVVKEYWGMRLRWGKEDTDFSKGWIWSRICVSFVRVFSKGM